ncbi:MAG: hypothetical protein ABI467_02240 [Kofleriaceae bacterium]
MRIPGSDQAPISWIRAIASITGTLVLCLAASSARADDPPRSAYEVRAVVEGGFVGVLSNFGAFGADATHVDFREAAGQDSLLAYTRWSAELELGTRHTLVFLYQPFASEGVFTPATDQHVEGVTFAAGAPVRVQFGFPYYRLSYLYELVQHERGYLAIGFTGQLRNADYRYARLDGTAFARSANVGFVPAFKARGELALSRSAFVGFDADGIYAPISVLNGSTNKTVGAILDASVSAGVCVGERGRAFANVRYLGGGATNEDPGNYAKNWLHVMFVGIGASFDLVGTPTRVRGTRC